MTTVLWTADMSEHSIGCWMKEHNSFLITTSEQIMKNIWKPETK